MGAVFDFHDIFGCRKLLYTGKRETEDVAF